MFFILTAMAADAASLQAFIDEVNSEYEKVHFEFEEQFWGTKMALKDPKFSAAHLSETKGKMEAFLSEPSRLEATKKWLASGVASEEQLGVLKIFERTFKCYIMESDEAKRMREETTHLESTLEEKRNGMELGAKLPDDKFLALSSVGLRNRMTTDSDEKVRNACYDGLLSIGPFICENGFVDIVNKRNRMAKMLGFVDFYDYKVTQSEGFGKQKLFEILDGLKTGTDELLKEARQKLAAEKGDAALQPWNTSFMMSGDIKTKLDPFFPFEKAVETWARSFAAMGIKYRDATMTLDLLDRKGKYSNGFCHWPQPAWKRPDGSWQPSSTNFTSLADPAAVGSGLTALTTLMHEAGHAAHFANVSQASPLFSQERAPTSVAYAENQSMFLDSLVGDAAWRARYARDRDGKVVPWELLEEEIRATKPYEVFELRRMLCVPYFEKALYELSEEELTAQKLQDLALEVETFCIGGPSPRPVLSIPHILSDEASCYYHGYVLAEMSVHQTRAYFLKTGPIVDNPIVGPTLTEKYWKPGNSAMFLDLVEGLTGKPLTADAWVTCLKEPLDEHLAQERKEYDAALQIGVAVTGELDLEMRVRIADGDEVIGDTAEDKAFAATTEKFERYVKQRLNSSL